MGQADSTVQAPASALSKLSIYVTRHCANCQHALKVAAHIREHYPHVELEVIDLDTATAPESVFATPTYLLNGRVWSLGNPSFRKIEDALCPDAVSHMSNGS